MRQNTKEFIDLQKEYYDRLAKDGFDDIEDVTNEERRLIEWHSFDQHPIDPLVAEAIREYYTAASRLLYSHSFKNKTEKRIWELYCEGMTIREIESKLGRLKKSRIHRIISEISLEIVKP